MIRLCLYTLVLSIILSNISYANMGDKNMDKYSTTIKMASIRYGVKAPAIKAIIAIESTWNPVAKRYEAHLKEYSMGLMQLLLSTAKEVSGNKNLTYEQLQNPTMNIMLGTKYFAKQLKRYDGNYSDAVAAYNAGSVKKALDGTYVNQAHVTKFNRWFKYYKVRETSMVTTMALPLFLFGSIYYVRSKK